MWRLGQSRGDDKEGGEVLTANDETVIDGVEVPLGDWVLCSVDLLVLAVADDCGALLFLATMCHSLPQFSSLTTIMGF